MAGNVSQAFGPVRIVLLLVMDCIAASHHCLLFSLFLHVYDAFQVRFQHSELVHKLEKVEQIRQRMQDQKKEQEQRLSELQTKIQERGRKLYGFQQLCNKQKLQRQASFLSETPETRPKLTPNPNEVMAFLKDILESEQSLDDGASSLQVKEKMVHLVKLQTRRLEQQSRELERTRVASLKRIAEGYRKHFGPSLNQLVMIQEEAEENETEDDPHGHGPEAVQEEENMEGPSEEPPEEPCERQMEDKQVGPGNSLDDPMEHSAFHTAPSLHTKSPDENEMDLSFHETVMNHCNDEQHNDSQQQYDDDMDTNKDSEHLGDNSNNTNDDSVEEQNSMLVEGKAVDENME